MPHCRRSEIIAAVLKSGHTRLPIFRERPDNILGILNARDLLAALQQADGDAAKLDVEKIAKPAWYVPDTRPISDQLNAFLRRKTHFALVVDEYGEVMGLITLEDILEEIVGDIVDEHDAMASGVRRHADGSFTIDGAVPIRDLNRALEWDLPDDEATTLAGLVVHEARMIPNPGQAFTFHGFRFEVLRKRRNQVTLAQGDAREAPSSAARVNVAPTASSIDSNVNLIDLPVGEHGAQSFARCGSTTAICFELDVARDTATRHTEFTRREAGRGVSRKTPAPRA